MRKALVLVVVGLVLFGLSDVAAAHTELDFSEPAEGAVIETPVTEIVVAFTLPVTIVGKGFEILDPSGEIVRPDVQTDHATVFVLVVEEPLAGGDVAVRYEVAAEDGHVLAGGFSFSVSAEVASATTTPRETTSVPASTSSTQSVTTTVTPTTTTEPSPEPSGPVLPWLVGAGLVLLAGIGIFAGVRSRSNQ